LNIMIALFIFLKEKLHNLIYYGSKCCVNWENTKINISGSYVYL